MIIERLTKLDEPKRKVAAVLVVLVAACICYYAITRNSLTKLKAVKTSYAGVQAVYAGTENQQTDFLNLQKQIKEEEEHLQEYQQQYFSSAKAVRFFENINVMALAYNLKPISRMISEPKKLSDNKTNDEKSEPQQQFLKTQSAKITVSGNYFDIVDFVKELAGRPQKICITNLHITLPAGEKFNPKASFKIILVIDQSKDVKK